MHDITVRADQVEARCVIAGWSHDNLAAHMGFSQSTVSRVLRGHIPPSRRFIAAALAVFDGTEFADLFILHIDRARIAEVAA